MTLPSSGLITMGMIQEEFKDMISPKSPKLSAYYGVVQGIPTSGLIKLTDFYGKTARITKKVTANINNLVFNDLFSAEEKASGAELAVEIAANVMIGSDLPNVPCVIVEPLANKAKQVLINKGNIYGSGGGVHTTSYKNGGTCIWNYSPYLSIDNQGRIWSGGGASGSGGRGGWGGDGYYEALIKEGPNYQITNAYYATLNGYSWALCGNDYDVVDVMWNGVSIYRTYTAKNGAWGVASISANGWNYFRGNIRLNNFYVNLLNWYHNPEKHGHVYEIFRTQNQTINTTGGIGGWGGNLVNGRGWNNLEGDLSANVGQEGTAGDENAGQGGRGGYSGRAGNWGQAGQNGVKGDSGTDGNKTNGALGTDGSFGGNAGHALVNVITLGEPLITGVVNWIKSGDLIGSVVTKYQNELETEESPDPEEP